MPRVPAFCNNCGSVFPSGFSVSDEGTLTVVGCKSGPCPRCESMGSVPDGVFRAAGDIIRLLAGPQKTIEQLQALASIISEARNTVSEPHKAVDRIKREAPELSLIVDVFPKTRNELYGFLTVILMAVGTVIAGAALYKDRSPSEADVQSMIDKTIERSFQERGETKKQQPHRTVPKPGRNEPCPCSSGKKYKQCCGRLI